MDSVLGNDDCVYELDPDGSALKCIHKTKVSKLYT